MKILNARKGIAARTLVLLIIGLFLLMFILWITMNAQNESLSWIEYIKEVFGL